MANGAIKLTSVTFPVYYRVVFREGTKWSIEGSKRSTPNIPLGVEGLQEQFGMTNLNLVASLFRINGGRAGYYLADLKDKKYYYCGSTLEDVRDKLLSLGVSQANLRERC